MARGRNGARKKPETSSSMDKGRAREFMLELARVFPSQKEKRDLIVVIFCRDMTLWGSYPHAPALNATGRLSSLQQKTFAPALWGILPWGPSLRQHPCWLGRVFCLRSAPSSVHFVPITKGGYICSNQKTRPQMRPCCLDEKLWDSSAGSPGFLFALEKIRQIV